jgi:tetratricopeptide (TPR) repeat protein
MITHCCRLTTTFRLAGVVTFFLLTLISISWAQQLTNADVPAAVKDLKNDNSAIRAEAARRLVLLAVKAKTPALVEASTPPLIEALKDPDIKVRNRAVMALGILWKSGQPGPEMKAAIRVLAALLKDDSEDTRLRAVYLLAALGPDAKAVIPALTEAARDQSVDVRYAVRSALEEIARPTVADIPELVAQLRDTNAEVRRGAARNLVLLKTDAKPALGPLLQALKDQNVAVRSLSLATLSNLIETQSDVGIFIKPFIDLLKDRDQGIRRQAGYELGKMGARAWAAVPALTAALSDDNESLRINAIYALKSIGWGSDLTTTSLINLLKDPRTDVRHAAASALSRVEVGSSIAVPVLMEDLKKDAVVRSSAVWALRSYGARAKDAVPALADMLDDDLDVWCRVDIARLIGKVGPGAKQVAPLLVKSLNDREQDVRVAVAVALLQVEPESESKIEPALLKLAKVKIDEKEPAAALDWGAPSPGGIGFGPTRPDEAGSYWYHGYIRYRQGDLKAAIENYTKAIEFDPQYTDAYYERAMMHRAIGDYAAAIADFTKVIEVGSEYLQVSYFERGMSQVENGNYDAAIADFTKVIELDNYSAEAYYRRGLAQYQKKNYKAAIVDYDRALIFVPQLTEVFDVRARLKLEQGNIAGGLADFDEAIRVNPTNATNYDNRIEALKSLGKLDAAEDFYRTALRGAPDDVELLNRLGYFLVDQNKSLSEALQLIQRAVTSQPANPIFLHSLGWANFKLGRYDEAQRYLEESVKQDLNSPLSLEHLGDVYEQEGKKEDAKAAWNKALSLTSDANTTRRLKGKLNLSIRL